MQLIKDSDFFGFEFKAITREYQEVKLLLQANELEHPDLTQAHNNDIDWLFNRFNDARHLLYTEQAINQAGKRASRLRQALRVIRGQFE